MTEFHAGQFDAAVIVACLRLKKLVGRTDIMFFAPPPEIQKRGGAPVRAIAEFREFFKKEMEKP